MGWYIGSSLDSQYTLFFSALSDVRSINEVFLLVEKLVSSMLDKYGRIDILVNVVGAYYLGGKTVAELEEKE
jgi:hypothetical protein